MDPKWTKIIAVVVVVVIVAAGATYYYVRTHQSTSCTLKSHDPLQVDQAEQPDSIDPAVTFSTPGWAQVQQVYQGLVQYNGTSYTTFVGVLAKNWSSSADGLHYNFTLWPNEHFSNGDPVTAYTLWYSYYRDLAMSQASQFILAENFWEPNMTYPTLDPNITNDLNNFNFVNPTPPEISTMVYGNQSFVALSPTVFQLNLGFGYLGHVPYTYLFASLSAPNGFAVDPVMIQKNGGVTNSTNSWMAQNMLGTGPYILQGTYNAAGTGYTLLPSPNYWGTAAAAAQPWNPMIQPALHGVQVNFQLNTQLTVSDMESGAAVTASFAYLGPSTVHQLQGSSCVVVQALPTVFGATTGSWWVYMNQSQFPFNNLSVRAAIVHAINYSQVISLAFGGYASQWVGPVPPSYPYYNPANLPPYPTNLALAKQEIANSPCKNNACAGTTYNFMYLDLGDWYGAATIIAQNLAQIGITVLPVKVPDLKHFYAEQAYDAKNNACTAQENSNGFGPFPIGFEFYTSDYISPDDWTQNDALNGNGSGSANTCMSGYNNATVYNLVYAAASDSNAANLTADYTTMTQLMYWNYTDAWLAVPTSFAVYSPFLHGFYENPMASAEPYSILFNTQTAS